MIRPGSRHDARFLRDMLHHAYYWRERTVPQDPMEGSVQRYVMNWGRPGDAAVIALDDVGSPVGAAWYRLFKASAPGYGFVDEQTPELTISVVPSRRQHGVGKELLDALLAKASEVGHSAVSLSVEQDSPAVKFYERNGFERVGEAAGGIVMLRRL